MAAVDPVVAELVYQALREFYARGGQVALTGIPGSENCVALVLYPEEREAEFLPMLRVMQVHRKEVERQLNNFSTLPCTNGWIH